MRSSFLTATLDYKLPPELIAQEPARQRDGGRLLVVDRRSGDICDAWITDLPRLLRPGDLVVLNDTKVLPAKFIARRKSGGAVLGLFIKEESPGRWEVMLRGMNRLRPGEKLLVDSDRSGIINMELLEVRRGGGALVRLDRGGSLEQILAEIGRTPLPPYIRRKYNDRTNVTHGGGQTDDAVRQIPVSRGDSSLTACKSDACLSAARAEARGSGGVAARAEARGSGMVNTKGEGIDTHGVASQWYGHEAGCTGGAGATKVDTAWGRQDAIDMARYQTVYAERPGAVAAPTAGLHLTEKLLEEMRALGIHLARVTLHIGTGTFKPITTERVCDHAMHAEWFELLPEAAEAAERCRRRGGRVVAVGTTSVRVLESAAREHADGRAVSPLSGMTDLLIYPPYRFRAVDALLTNFHLPRTTLLALVMALAGIDVTRRAYRRAIDAKYRFYSFGDAMLII